MRASLAVALAGALALAGCGGEDRAADTAPASTPSPTASAAPTASPTATATGSPTATPPPTATPASPEDQQGGAGDEEAARVPIALTVRAGGVDPPRVSVPAFLALELSVRNQTGGEITVRIIGPERPTATTLSPGATASKRLAGLRPGRYAIETGGGRRATLIVGAEPGP